MSDRPRIGITSWPRAVLYEGIPEWCDTFAHDYVRSVIDAGGLPVLLPLGDAGSPEDDVFDQLLGLVDGVLLTGGGDVEPRAYDAEPDLATKYTDAARDAYDARLVRTVLDRGVPTLGVCRALQMVNVVFGGTLAQDLPHHERDNLADQTAHTVAVAADSHLAAIVGTGDLGVNSLHHQGIDRLATGLRPVAESPDGLVEAVEVDGNPHLLAVQWHPELLCHRPEQLALFRDLVERSRH